MGSRFLSLGIMLFVLFCFFGCSDSVSKEDYEKIQLGMSRDEVLKILGSPTMKSESETMGIKTEILHYQTEGGLGTKAITIIIQDGTVVDKQWTEL